MICGLSRDDIIQRILSMGIICIISLFMPAPADLVWYLNSLLIARSLDNSVDIDAGYVDVLLSESPNIYHLFHLHGDTE